MQTGSRNRTLNVQSVTGIYDVTSEKDAVDMCVDPNVVYLLLEFPCESLEQSPSFELRSSALLHSE